MNFSERYNKAISRATSSEWMGEAVLFYRKENPDSDPTEIQGVPSRQAIELVMGDGTVSRSRRATFGVCLSDLEAKGVVPKKDDIIELKGVRLRIKDMDPDGEGFSSLILTKVAA